MIQLRSLAAVRLEARRHLALAPVSVYYYDRVVYNIDRAGSPQLEMTSMLDVRRLKCWYRSAWLVVGLGTVACGAEDIVDPPDDGPPLDFTGTWNPSTNLGGPWGHDGSPVVSDNFLVFSGYASQAARQYASDVAEESLGEIMEFYAITPDAFEFMPTYEEPKIHILAIKDQDFRRNSGFAYRDGLVIISRESPNYQAWGFEPVRYKRLIQHETMHVVEFLLIGNPVFRQASDVWWREGVAHYMSRPRPSMITTRQQVEEWRDSHQQLPGGGNPIAIHVWSNFPQAVVDAGTTGQYYDMFELTIRYLLDEAGNGGSPQDVLDLYDTMGSGFTFARAARDHFGIDLEDFQNNYWEIMLDYLDRTAQ